ncbi:MoxR family ATPase [Candidatus Woesearchaeota archaeon]|nr:MAG: MoxR family ATPase [Candidatus Woesearchaeota archaeon]
MIAMACDGNALLESYPGLGKTQMIKAIAQVMDLKFSRIQSTPDLMPSDITGTYVLEEKGGRREFNFHKGPIFANIVLVDEINRATPKTQSALLEAMQEKQVTVGTQTFKLDKPFFVLATQNPIEMEGTYPLPEAQTDRFLLKIKVDYPSEQEEHRIMEMYGTDARLSSIAKHLNAEALAVIQNLVRQVPIANDLKQYIIKIVHKTRNFKEMIEYGASPRASIGLILASKAHALIEGRNHVSKTDIEVMAYPVLRHRIILNFEAERANVSTDDAIKKVLEKV